MIDVDHFKHYNDANGHPAGDAVLRGVAAILAEGRRLNDVVARYGGEEFAILLIDTAGVAAEKLAEALRGRVEEQRFEHANAQPGGKLTISLGVATCPDQAKTAVELVQAADTALYRAKNAGRNRIGQLSEPQLPPSSTGATS